MMILVIIYSKSLFCLHIPALTDAHHSDESRRLLWTERILNDARVHAFIFFLNTWNLIGKIFLK